MKAHIRIHWLGCKLQKPPPLTIKQVFVPRKNQWKLIRRVR